MKFSRGSKDFDRYYKEPNTAARTLPPHEEFKKFVKKNHGKLGKVLEVGPGEGKFSFYLAENGSEVVGIDFSPRAVHIANGRAKDLNLSTSFLVGDFEDINERFSENSFDFVFDWRCLTLMLDPTLRKNYFQSIKKVLKNGGIYLTCAFSGDGKDFGEGYLFEEEGFPTTYTPPLKITQKELQDAGFTISEAKHIEVQQKRDAGDVTFKCNYLICSL